MALVAIVLVILFFVMYRTNSHAPQRPSPVTLR